MPLAANSKLGPYEIKSVLGVGGMGEVYRARDSRLNRDVAIKVLRQDSAPDSSGASADLRSRFEREARAVAALNHPNIIAVYDFGIEPSASGAKQYIVSELLEGESLRALLPGPPLKPRPLPVRRLIEIAAQIADGLSAAHAAEIVHRDLKPENIMLGKDGRAKILDFGLARRIIKTPAAIPPGSDETFLPDSRQNRTSAGSILGTAAYMSPEQALGNETDYRSDQFSFGLILHEMATGKQAFARNSSVETMAAIVRDEPPPIGEKLPAPLKWIIDRCLQKEPEQRYESTRDLYRDLRNLKEHFSEAYSSSEILPPVAVPTVRRYLAGWKVAALCTACIAVTAFTAYVLKPSGQILENYRYTPFASDAYKPIWSADGKSVAYSKTVNGVGQVYLRYFTSRAPIQLTHEKHALMPLGWSNDKNHVFVVEQSGEKALETLNLYSVPVVGGEPEFVMQFQCHASACDISRDGRVLATRIKDKDGFYRIAFSDPIGSPLKIYASDPSANKQESDVPWLAFSPNGRKLLYSYSREDGRTQNWLLSYPVGSFSPRLTMPDLPSEIDGLSWLPDSRHVICAASDGAGSGYHLWMGDTSSRENAQLTVGTARELWPSVSPDGKTILLTQTHNDRDLVSVSVTDGSAASLVSTGHFEALATWSVGRGDLAWTTDRSGQTEIWTRTTDGSERPLITAADLPDSGGGTVGAPSFSPDGRRLVFDATDKASVRQLWIFSLNGGSPIRLSNVESAAETGGSWSPDGNRFAYLQQRRNAAAALMVIRTGGNAVPTELKDSVTTFYPAWSPAGNWIAYRDENGWNLISPDGKSSKFLGKIESNSLVFSKDGKLVYGIDTGHKEDGRDHVTLFSLDITSFSRRDIKDLGQNYTPSSWDRLSLAPDGKSLAYSVSKIQYELWLLTGYRQFGLWNQIKDAFHSKAGN